MLNFLTWEKADEMLVDASVISGEIHDEEFKKLAFFRLKKNKSLRHLEVA
jgi:hypothetical protein